MQVYPHAADYGWPAWSFIVAQLCTFITELALVLGIHQGAKRAWAQDFVDKGLAKGKWTQEQAPCSFSMTVPIGSQRSLQGKGDF